MKMNLVLRKIKAAAWQAKMATKKRALESEVLLVASRFRVERITQHLADGTRHSREIIKHPGAVVILPILPDGSLCLIRNYRVAVDRVLLELPAGTLEPNEPPIETARRELIEETGFRCTEIVPLCEFAMSPGILDERMHAFVAKGLVAGDPAREIGEQIENLIVSPTELEQMLRTGQIEDAKTLATLLYYLRYSA